MPELSWKSWTRRSAAGSSSRAVLAGLPITGGTTLTVLPVNYRVVDGAILFRTGQDSPTGEDLRTGIAHADYKVAFEIDRKTVPRRALSVPGLTAACGRGVRAPAHGEDAAGPRAVRPV